MPVKQRRACTLKRDEKQPTACFGVVRETLDAGSRTPAGIDGS